MASGAGTQTHDEVSSHVALQRKFSGDTAEEPFPTLEEADGGSFHLFRGSRAMAAAAKIGHAVPLDREIFSLPNLLLSAACYTVFSC